MVDEKTKDETLRNNEYYCMQETFDYLYKLGLAKTQFTDLIKYIKKPNNVRLAYRNIKTNKGSKTKGISGKTMEFISNMKFKVYIYRMTKKIDKYEPNEVKRVGIPKSNGKIRYLGIKEPEDKIVEQAIYQILDPIFMATFHNNSNGFIKGRSTARAICQMETFIIKEKLYYVVDIDIKGFFDNVNHGKLLKQLWTLGIRDKNLLSLISKMLKAKINGVGVPIKGTPQGGILSPLLANVYLNELDWWLDSKKAKGIRFVRYADDFKILCPTYQVARDMLNKTTKWLKERLYLEVSKEKTKIVNLKRNNSYFLGLRFKLKKHKKEWKIVSHMMDKSKERITSDTKSQLRKMKKSKNNKKNLRKEIDKYNSKIIGIHNYYKKATEISYDVRKIGRILSRYIINNFREVLTFQNKIDKNNFVIRTYGKQCKLPYIHGSPIVPMWKITYEKPKYKGNKINYYEENSRKQFHKELEIVNINMINNILNTPKLEETVEFNDNSLSKFCGQIGKYAINRNYIYDMSKTHIIKYNNIKRATYDNILIVDDKIYSLLNYKGDDSNELFELKKGLNYEQLMKINLIRKENNRLSI